LELIQSRENSLLKQVRKLKEKRYRTESNQFLIEGFRFLDEAVKSSFEVPYVFVNENNLDKWNASGLGEHIRKDTKVYLIKDAVFKTIAGTESPQGVIAVVCNKKSKLKEGDGFYVLVDRIQDPGNMGTIIRTAHAAGALGLLYTKGTVDIYNEKTLRSSMGSIFHLPVIEDESINITRELKTRGFKLIVSSLDTKESFYDIDLKGNSIICVGNEGNGISDEVLELCDEKVRIPMPGGAESLNAAVAASIMIFEAVRQSRVGKNSNYL
jgi:RNA methyltransferase, TrmH family